jgi:hypothetical protein
VNRLIGLLMLVASASAAAMNAEELLATCRATSGRDYCSGYIAGFYDGRTTSDYGKPELMACLPTDSTGKQLAVSQQQMVQVFLKWAADHPERLHYHD